MKLSINKLVELTGKTYRTVKKRCAHLPSAPGENNSIVYESSEALAAIYNVGSGDEKDLAYERTRLAKAQANKTEIEVAEKKGLLIPAADVEQAWAEIVAAIRSKLLGLPVKLARVAMAAKSLKEVEEAARTEIYTTLSELSNTEIK